MNEMHRGLLVLGCLVALAADLSASAQEKRISKSELPEAVQKRVEEQSRNATVRGFSKEIEGGKTYYEVELSVSGHSKDVLMDPSGEVVEVEEEVALSLLPPTVSEGLQKKAGSGKIVKVESLTKHGTLVAYEAQVRTGNTHSEVQVGPKGETLAHPE
jgi:hypothetical protein